MNTDPETVQSIPEAETAVPAEENKKSKKNNKKQKEKNSIGAALRLIRRNFFGFFWFEVLYKLLTFSIAIPLIRKVSSAVLYFNGISNITNDNFLGMMKHPATWIGMLVSVYILGVMISIEFSGIFAGLHAADCGKKISAGEMFTNGLASCTSVFNIKNWLYLVFVIIVMPMASITETATLTQSFTIPGFILEGIDEKWYLQILYYGGTVALMYLVLRWIYAIPDMNIMHRSFSKAAAESSRLMHKHIWKGVIAVLICYLVLFFIFGVLAVAIICGAAAVIAWLDPGVNVSSVFEPIVISDAVIVYILTIVMTLPLLSSRVYIGYKRQMKEEDTVLPEYVRPKTWLTENKWVKIGLTACLAAGVFFFMPARYQEVKLLLTNAAGQTMVMAHRGDSVDAPENTLPAFQAAIDHGADAAEMDVQMTKDGTIVVMHDSSIDRTSTGSGNIWEVTYDEIKDLDNGSFFSPDFSDTRIPTLDQVIKLCKGKLYLNIEIKRTGHDDGIEQKVIDIIKGNQFQGQCDITSMDYNTLVTVKNIDPTIKTVYTTTVALGNVEDLKASDAFSVEGTFVNQSFMRSMRQNGKEVYVWTINDEGEMQTMINMGVNAIITNDPVTCRDLVDSDEEKGVMGVLNRLKTGIVGA